jgi:AsmA protein
MGSKPFVRKFFWAVLLVCGIIASAIAAAPFFVDGLQLRDAMAARLTQFTGGDVQIKGRVRIASFFTLGVEAEDVRILNASKLNPVRDIAMQRVRANIGWMDLLRGEKIFDKIVIEQSMIVLAKNGETGRDLMLQRAMTALETAPFETIVLDDAVFEISGETKPLKMVNGRFFRSGGGRRLTSRATVIWKDQPLTFRARRGRKTDEVGGDVTAPVEISVSGVSMNGSFTGRLHYAQNLTLKGEANAHATDFSALASWLNLNVTSPPVVSVASVEGLVTWSREGVSFEQAVIEMENLAAEGALTVRDGGGCAVVDGALAFKTLDLRSAVFPSAQISSSPCVRADVRLSADEVVGDSFQAGPAAATVSFDRGKVSANVAELQIFDGVVRGYVEGGFSEPAPLWVVRATAHDVDVSRLAEAARAEVWLEGRADANLELRAQGATLDTVASSLNGQAKVQFPLGGAVSTTFLDRFADVSSNGVTLADLTPRKFSRLRLEFGIVDGVAAARALEVNAATSNVYGRGSVDFPQSALDWRLKIVPETAPAAATFAASKRTTDSADAQIVTVQGAWRNPEFTLNERPMLSAKKARITPY